jgi:hypothetical protein
MLIPFDENNVRLQAFDSGFAEIHLFGFIGERRAHPNNGRFILLFGIESRSHDKIRRHASSITR